MLIQISFDEKDVIEFDKNKIILKCQRYQNPMLPIWLCTMKDESKPAIEGRYVNVSQRGTIKVGAKY